LEITPYPNDNFMIPDYVLKKSSGSE